MALPSFFQPKEPDPYGPQIDRKRVALIFGSGILVLLLVIFAFISLLTNDHKGEYVRMVAHEQNLSSVVQGAQKRIRNGELAKVNSDAGLLLSTNSVALVGQLQKRFGEKGVTADILKQEADATIEEKLKSAELLDKFDITYRNVIRQKISELNKEAVQLRDAIGGKEFTAVIDKLLADIKTIDTQLKDLTLQ